MRAAIKSLVDAHPAAPLLVTGHSLGGALALLAALDIRALFPSVKVALYTYGQPRVGNLEFSNYADQLLPISYKRVVHYDDMVAHVPPRISGYQHAGDEVWYKNKQDDGYYVECINSAFTKENDECSNSLWIKAGIEAHKVYFGQVVSDQCTRRQPSGTLTADDVEVECVAETEFSA